MSATSVLTQFAAHFGDSPRVLVRAPGRVNLIGDHTDYNDGFALPVAIAEATWVAIRRRADQRILARAQDFGQTVEWNSGEPPGESMQGWARYVAGVETLLRERGAVLGGFELLIHSTIPIGSGISSSAALTIGCAKGLANLCGATMSPIEMIDLARMAEERFAGVPCGILDQTAILLSKAAHALQLDCRSREVQYIPIAPGGAEFLLVDSKLPRTLAGSAYAQRRAECDRAVAYFAQTRPDVRALRDLDPDTVRRHASQMDPVAFARALHVVTENQRVLEFADEMQQGNWERAGEIMDESHASLRDQYEVSTPDLERVIRCVRSAGGVLGARVTGAGFGGCLVVLTQTGTLDSVRDALQQQSWPSGRTPQASSIVPSDGATLEPIA